MRIALVSDCYPPRLGGIETQVSSLARALVADGHDVTVITATPAGPERGEHTEVVDGVRVTRLTARLPAELPVNPWARPRLIELLAAFDAVHIHTGIVSPFARLATTACLQIGRRAVITWHCHLGDARAWYRYVNPLQQWHEAGMVLTAVSRAAADAIERAAQGRVAVGVLPNLIEREPWDAIRRGDHPSAGGGRGLRLVTATRLAARKRVVPLARLVGQAAQRAPMTLDIFGDGPQRTEVERLIRLGAPVTLRGRVGPAELAAAYRQAGVFVSPVVKEAFGIAALEARAAGLPVIYRAGSGIEEFIEHGVAGLRVESDEEMSAALAMLASIPQQLAALREHTLATPVTHTWQEGLDQFVAAYRSVQR
ncbi:Glycosyltransferase involved in cell wall bisynthesis [Bowdeniella nasicola]|uniref:Glycosyltransferase involved in cell wall bisynthesis n=1 Tax=Bowdeniella nasicola TaxID=208480 RepID=A0A1H4C3P7_9ACTO|nr:glycosyltransferase family 4 protein [Bowdeniella nasicola]SEA54999.1 Glycosyltransferase involved in cell wall bisynthesis [Bowdeniella nasicola]